MRGLVWARTGTLTVYYGLMLAFLAWLVRRRGSDLVSAFALRAFAPVYALWTAAVVLVGLGLPLVEDALFAFQRPVAGQVLLLGVECLLISAL